MDDDMILPDDYEAPPQAEVEQEQEFESDVETEVEDTKPPEEPTEPTKETPQTLKLKFNHEEKEISLDEAAILAQKGMNYEKAVERAAQEARDAYIAEQGHQWNGKAITTEAEYKQALAEQELMSKYQDRDLPPEVIEELMAGRRDREERAKEKAVAAEQAKNNAQFNDFLNYFQQSNSRSFDPAKDTIPKEVYAAVEAGASLKAAFIEHENKELRNQLKVAKQNETNSKKAPVGSVTSHGSTETVAEDEFMRGFNSV